MAKDYKAYSNSSKKKSKSSNSKVRTFVWLTIIAFVVAGFIYGLFLLSHRQKGVQTVPVSSSKTTSTKNESPKKESPKLKFEFYNILPKEQGAAPVKGQAPVVSAEAPTAPSPPIQALPTVPGYVLQVTSVRNFNDADALRAKLTLEGFDVAIKNIVVQGVIWYRVQLGPFTSKKDALATQENLKKNNVTSWLKKE
jgi:cell division protein FtsN